MGILTAMRTPGPSPAPTGPVHRGSWHELWDRQRLPAGIMLGWGPSADPPEAASSGSWSHVGTIYGRSCPIAAAWLPLPWPPFTFSQLNSTLLLKIPREMRVPDRDSAGGEELSPGATSPTVPRLMHPALTLAWDRRGCPRDKALSLLRGVSARLQGAAGQEGPGTSRNEGTQGPPGLGKEMPAQPACADIRATSEPPKGASG